MALSTVIRNIGQTTALSVGNTSTAAQSIQLSNNDVSCYAAFLNTGSATVAINIAPNGTAAPAVLPVAGTPQNVIILPPNMTQPTIYAVPPTFSCTAIGSAAGPSLVYITPVGAQS